MKVLSVPKPFGPIRTGLQARDPGADADPSVIGPWPRAAEGHRVPRCNRVRASSRWTGPARPTPTRGRRIAIPPARLPVPSRPTDELRRSRADGHDPGVPTVGAEIVSGAPMSENEMSACPVIAADVHCVGRVLGEVTVKHVFGVPVKSSVMRWTTC